MTDLEHAVKLLRELVEEDDCQFDHNHSCQMHGYFYLDQGEMCPMEETKRFLKDYDRQQGNTDS